jgi:hypothetical protein
MFGVFMVALFVLGCLKNIWVRVKWHVFGWRPNILDETQLNVTVQFCTEEFVRQWTENCLREGREVTEEETEACRNVMQDYSRAVIEQYIHNFLLPCLGCGVKGKEEARPSTPPPLPPAPESAQR